MKFASSSPLSPIFADYQAWLSTQPLSPHTRRTYLTQVRQYYLDLSEEVNEYGVLCPTPPGRNRKGIFQDLATICRDVFLSV